METNSLSKNLIYQRKLKGYSQEELSGKTNVTVRTIQRIEKGDVNPHLQTVKLLAAALEIEVDELLVLEDPKEEAIQKKWLLLMHGTPILGLILPLCNIFFPLFLWIHKREDNKVYDTHGRAIVNFQITMTILFILSFFALVTVEKWGFFMFIAVIPYAIIVMIINVITAVNTQKFFYPLSFPFIKKGVDNKSGILPILCVLMICVIQGCSGQTSGDVIRLDGSIISKDSLTRKAKQLVEDGNVHGLALTVFNDDKIAYQKTFGYSNFKEKTPLTDSTNIYGASFSKAVFAVLVLKLVEEGALDLDTPLESYLPKKIYEYAPKTRWHDDFSSLEKDSLYSKITTRMCLSHTSGFPNWRWFEPDYQLRVKFEPGTRYLYSGEGLTYLQVVLEKMLDTGLEELAQKKIFGPLGMHHSSYHWKSKFNDNVAYGHTVSGELHPKDTDNEPRGASTLETTAADYSTFLEAVLQQKLISENSWAALFSPQIRIRSKRQFGPLSTEESSLNDAIELSYGLGWGVLKTPYGIGAFKEGHGDGFQHYSIVFPKLGKGIMIMTNSDNGGGIFKELLEVAIGDTYTPWEWENYIPYQQR